MTVTSYPTTAPTADRPPASPNAHYCNCAIPLAVERAERHGAAYRACVRCNLPIAVRWSRW